VVGLVVRDGAALAALGTALGLAGALAGSRLLASLVFGVTPHDAATFLGVAAAVMAAAGLASWLPARRAARAEAATVLRGE
jgi:putative ABC transport system permease protein